ncbi:alpha/beta hydrolase [Phytoactinopolyspora mesophila]|nr:alpha/beta fold hydrolase [Phytoactinopolyspora mesophila]
MRLSALRAAFTVLDRTAPRLAGRWAFRLWCTLPDTSGRRQDNRPFPGTRSAVRLGDGREIAVETWTPTNDSAARTIYLIHGWGGWRGQLGAFVEPLLNAGCRVIAFDVPSHGDSPAGMIGRGRATALDFSDALTGVVTQHGEPAGIVAHSMGSAATALAVRDGLPAKRVVFIAPEANPISTVEQVEQLLGYGPRSRQFLYERLARLAARPLDDFNALRIGSDEVVPPALIIHDRDDKRLPYKGGVRLAEVWPESEMVTTEGLGHQRILIDNDVVKLTADYLTSPPR